VDLRTQLQANLGTAFVLERELGGGGMSRVFVANEVRLSRKVVIKVLTPELAQGLNAERFEREILLAASLQQANIVPVLTAGDLDGLPYFTMPFVDGESLRNRIVPGGLPIDDVVAILRDVTKALAYAHARNIVHRDIKPDNVLLSGGTAVVTDFGIAKALSASRTQGAGATLTSIGTSIGTPAYMAPEQVAGDPNLDHRVDLYALGCMAQELLTGRTPFAERAPQKMLAAHLSESPPPVSSLRPDCPPALASLVTDLLRKDPADRPKSATDVLQALGAVSTSSRPTLALDAPGMLPRVLGIYVVATAAVAIVAKAAVVGIGLPDWVFPGAVAVMLLGLPALLVTAYVKRVARQAALTTPTRTPGGSVANRAPSGTMATMALKASPHMSWRRTTRAGAVMLGAFVLAVVAFMTLRGLGIGPWGSLVAAGKLGAQDRIVLADLKTAPEDSALAPIVIEAVRAAMSQSRAVHLVPQTDVADALEQMKRPRDSRLDDPALVSQVAARTNAKAVLGGRLARAGTGYAVSLELVGANGGAVLASYQGTANTADLLSVVDGLTRKLRGKVGESLRQVQRSVPLERATTTSLDALRKYSEAVVANDINSDFPRAEQLSREAVALDSTFALAWRKLAVVLFNSSGSRAAEDSALGHAFRYADKLPDREKYLAQGAYYTRARTAIDRGKALAAYQAAYAADSGSGAAASWLQLIFADRLQFDSASHYSRRMQAFTPGAAMVAIVASTLATVGRVDSATMILDSLFKANPAAATDDGVIWGEYYVVMGRGHADSAMLITEALLKSKDPGYRVIALGNKESAEQVDGHLARAAATDSEYVTLAASRGATAKIYGLVAAVSEIEMHGNHDAGARAVDAIIGGPEWAAAAPIDRPYLGVATLYAEAGRADKARQLLARFDAEDPAAKAPNNGFQRAAVLGEIALAENKPQEALRQFRAATVGEDGAPTGCDACNAFNVGRAFDAAGQPDSAIAQFTAYLAVPVARRINIDYRALARVEKRLGELYDARHDRQNAIKHYAAFVDQWKTADADLQPGVTSVRKRLTELRSQEGK
jgi:tetratricopeptide (TPR) repeat protein/TolB-like protein